MTSHEIREARRRGQYDGYTDGYVDGLRYGIVTTQQADCTCSCQDDLNEELMRVLAADEPSGLTADELRGYRKGMQEAAHIADVEAAVGRGSRPTARALAKRFREEAGK